MLNVTAAPTVRVRVGRPFTLPGEDLDADTEAIMAAIVDLLPPEAREHHEPTPEELALTLPAGYKGDADAEDARRPGTD
jgi:putative phosphoserine phosphatase/1-acylglycerol-3-phosphate O-acyltransferase